MTLQLIAVNSECDLIEVSSIEDRPVFGISVKPLLRGEKALLAEFHLRKGTVIPRHMHKHECLCYIVHGKVKVEIGDETRELGQGDAFLHPVGVPHVNKVLEDTIWIEVKIPPEKTW